MAKKLTIDEICKTALEKARKEFSQGRTLELLQSDISALEKKITSEKSATKTEVVAYLKRKGVLPSSIVGSKAIRTAVLMATYELRRQLKGKQEVVQLLLDAETKMEKASKAAVFTVGEAVRAKK